jgi:hypothetical protein
MRKKINEMTDATVQTGTTRDLTIAEIEAVSGGCNACTGKSCGGICPSTPKPSPRIP